MLRSILAVLGGFATMAVLVMVATAVAASALVPGGLRTMRDSPASLPRSYLAANLLLSALAAFIGGAVTARLAPGRPFTHVAALATLMVVMTLLSARTAGTRQPAWYRLLLGTVMPGIALAGAYLFGQIAGAA